MNAKGIRKWLTRHAPEFRLIRTDYLEGINADRIRLVELNGVVELELEECREWLAASRKNHEHDLEALRSDLDRLGSELDDEGSRADELHKLYQQERQELAESSSEVARLRQELAAPGSVIG